MPTAPATKAHWAVRMNHRNRRWSFAMLALLIGWHWFEPPPSAGFWVALGITYLLYPQLAFQLARRAQRQLEAEIWNMRFDSLLVGAWAGYLGFPAWIGFSMFIGTQLNLMLFRGLPGLFHGTLIFFGSAGLSWWFFAPGWQTATHWGVTLLCQVSLTAYLMTVAYEAYLRSVKLSLARRTLRDNADSLHLQLSEIKALQSLLREQANRDALTGLYNRRYFESTMDRELARCARDQAPLSLILIDVDHFKSVNDLHGHQMGDAVLRCLGATLSQEARASDVVCRYGGEEFLLLLPGMNGSQAKQRAEKIRLAFEQSRAGTETGDLQVTLSAGVASYPQDGRTATELLRQADEALYRAKRKGRNRVESCSASEASA